jgi:hypothetical protein
MARLSIRMALVLMPLCLAVSLARAWGPHSEITVAAAKVLDKDDPFLRYVDNDMGVLRAIAWANDNASGCMIVGYRGYRICSRDFFDYPGWVVPWGSDIGHGYDPKDDSYKMFFNRTIQAMRTETPDNAIGWMGSIIHLMEDSGSPSHAGHVPWKYHIRLENWVDPDKVDIAGYKPQLFGKTPEEALAGLYKRVGELHDFSAERGAKGIPLVERNNRPAAERIILESALETTRVTADLLHTLGYLQSQMKAVPGAGSLAGTVTPGKNEQLLTPKVMLLETPYSTLCDIKGHYAFRNLPPGKYLMAVMLPTCSPKFQDVRIEADKVASQDVQLETTGNLLRNGEQTVWFLQKDRPDGWLKGSEQPKPGQPQCESETVLAKPGQAFRLTVKWKKGAKGEAGMIWNRQAADWDADKALKSGTESMVFQPPKDMKDNGFVSVFVHGIVDPWETMESISVTAEPTGTTAPAAAP